MKRTLFLWAAGMLLLSAVPAQALMIGLSNRQLVDDAALIVVGRVVDVVSYWNDDDTLILSRARIDVRDRLKGARAGSVYVEYSGGTVGGLTMRESDAPAFADGEDVIVFLRPAQWRAGREAVYRVVGRAQGKYSIAADGIARKRGFSVTAATEPLVERSVNAAELIARIRELVDEE